MDDYSAICNLEGHYAHTWDTGDAWYDSVVLLDNFVWSVTASTPGTHQ